MYRLKDLMMMLDIPERTIRRHLSEGVLKGEKVGGTWRFSEQNIKEYTSNEEINQYLEKNNYNVVIDFLNGFSKSGDHLVLINKKLSTIDMVKLTDYVNKLDGKYNFKYTKKSGKGIILFNGDKDNVQRIIDFVNVI